MPLRSEPNNMQRVHGKDSQWSNRRRRLGEYRMRRWLWQFTRSRKCVGLPTCRRSSRLVGSFLSCMIAGLTKISSYDEHLLRDALRAMDEYHDCPNPQCNSGQAHPFEAHPMLRCDNCKRFMCTRHEIPWHDGLTCSEYDTAVADYANSYENQLSQDEINDIAQSCPDCDAPIEKDQGHQCYETDCMWLYEMFAGSLWG